MADLVLYEQRVHAVFDQVADEGVAKAVHRQLDGQRSYDGGRRGASSVRSGRRVEPDGPPLELSA